MKDKLTLKKLDQLRALSDPLRFRLVEALIGAEMPATGPPANGVKAMAKEFPAWLESFQRRHCATRSADYRLVFAAFRSNRKRRG